MRRRGRLIDEPFEEAQPNLTPLIDVVFVVLITFMLIAPLLEIDRISLAEAPVAEIERVAVNESSPITIHVRSNDAIFIQGREVHLENLKEALEGAKRQFPGATPQLFQDKLARFGTYQQVKNAIQAAGFDEMDILLEPA